MDFHSRSAPAGGSGASNSAMGIGFGFNNPDFSDRVLRIEVAADPPESKLKKTTPNSVKKSQNDDGSPSRSGSPCRVETVHICSLILASKSPFFYKLFSNGMRESRQQAVALSVHASEESALLDLLQFTYIDTLKANTSADLLNVLVLADRYQVDLCVTHCAQTLSTLSMTFELAISCLNLPSSVIESDNSHLRSLLDMAKHFISDNFSTHHEAALKLPLESIENILSWDTLKVDCEDDVYKFLLEWVMTHYENLNERRQIFSSRLLRLIRFPYLSCKTLKSILQCNMLEQGDATYSILEALLSMSGNHLSQIVSTSSCSKRAYIWKPVEVTVFHRPRQECIVYTELEKDECGATMKNGGYISTQGIYVGNESFCLQFLSSQSSYGIYLHWFPCESTTSCAVMIDAEVAVRSKTTDKYVTQGAHSSELLCLEDDPIWIRIGESWEQFMAEDSEYFIDGVLYVRVILTIQQ